MSYHFHSDSNLVTLLQGGDAQAFKEIYERYWKLMYLSALKKVREGSIAEELVQNIFVSLWEKRISFKIDQLDKYLYSAVRYQVINYIKSAILRREHLSSCEKSPNGLQAENAASRLLQRELMDAVNEALEKMSETTQTIFKLSRFDHCSTKEIARQTHLTEKAVEYHITKSLKKMRTHLKDYAALAALLYLLV